MHKLCFFVPESHLEEVKTAIFETGAGSIGDYEACAWQTKGQGQFRPGPGSDPYIGEEGKISRVEEFKVEIVCEDDRIHAAVAALKDWLARRGATVFGDPAPVKTCPACLSDDLPVAAGPSMAMTSRWVGVRAGAVFLFIA